MNTKRRDPFWENGRPIGGGGKVSWSNHVNIDQIPETKKRVLYRWSFFRLTNICIGI